MNSQAPDRNTPDNADSLAIRKARELFERASARLDVGTSNRLRLLRRDAQSASLARRSLRTLMPMGAAAATMLAVGLVWWLPRDQAGAPPGPAVAIEAAQDAYLTDEDAEVYAWLGEAPVATDNEPAGAL